MTNPHHSMSHPLDPHPVRPGTSAALTARTIDATIHPPLVRAHEAVAAFIPRVSAPIMNSPFLFAMLGTTLLFIWVARRKKYHPSALVLSALLVMTLTSFHPVTSAEEPSAADESVAREARPWRPFQIEVSIPVADSSPMPDAYDLPSIADPMPPAPDMDVPMVPPVARMPVITADAIRRMVSPETMREMMTPEEMEVLEQEQQQLRIAIDQMRRQLRQEARRAQKRYF